MNLHLVAVLLVVCGVQVAWEVLQWIEAEVRYSHITDTGPAATPVTFWGGLLVILVFLPSIGEVVKAVAGWLR